MDGIREYLISVTAAALLCGILKSLMGEKGSSAALVRLICGIFLALTVIRPLKELNLQDLSLLPTGLLEEARATSGEGEEYTRLAKEDLIKQQCEAYILDKAQTLEASIQVEILISQEGDPIPAGSIITGNLSPYARNQLSETLTEELGIPQEDQKWKT
ncbi:MAG: hypothetical protein IKK72_05690 [Oscillospiraceae bacterium]|nr:hypothetical protein [Oscillospiraceae bacterium]